MKYYFKNESVVLEIPRSKQMGNTYVSFNCYSLHNRKRFKKFANTLKNSEPTQYSNLNDIFGLATRYGIRPTNGSKPTFTDNIAF